MIGKTPQNPLTNKFKISFEKGMIIIVASDMQAALDRGKEMANTAGQEVVAIRRMRENDEKEND